MKLESEWFAKSLNFQLLNSLKTKEINKGNRLSSIDFEAIDNQTKDNFLF